MKEGIKMEVKDWRNILIIALILFSLTAIFTLVQPLKYRSSSRLLIVQQFNGIDDPYVVSKSTQYLSDILAEVIYSSSFMDEVIHSGYNIDKSYFSKNEQKRKKQWAKMINARTISDTGIIAIDIYHKDREQVSQIAQAVSYILKTKHNLYHGAGDKVSVMLIDKPITTNWPVKPNIIVNLALALIFGLFFGIGFVYYFPDYNLKESLIKLFANKRRANNGLEFDVENDFNDFINIDIDTKEDVFTKKEELYDDFER